MAHVDNGYRHVTHYLVVVNPRIEERVEKRHEKKEDEYSFVSNGGTHFLCPDVAHVFYPLPDVLVESLVVFSRWHSRLVGFRGYGLVVLFFRIFGHSCKLLF